MSRFTAVCTVTSENIVGHKSPFDAPPCAIDGIEKRADTFGEQDDNNP